MDPFKNVFLVILALQIVALVHGSITGYITTSDKKKFLQILTSSSASLEVDDVASLFYSAKGYKLLNHPYDKNYLQQNCAHIKKYYKPSVGLEATYNAFNTWSLLGCEGKLQNENTLKELQAALASEKSSTSDIRYAIELLTLLKQPIPNPTKVAQLLQARLKDDDSLPSVGHALHAAALLGPAGKFALDRIEDVVVQADEVDGKLLQWEGGLTTTALLTTGLLRLPEATPFTVVQAEKLANYLLSRRTVQTAKGVLALLEAAGALAASKVSPVSISIVGSSQVLSVEKPELRVQVSDIFGQPLKTGAASVIAQSATRINDDVVVLAKQSLTPSNTSPTEFILSLRLEPGYYRVVINAAGSHSATFNARILGPLTIKSLEIGLTDADGSSAPKLSKLSHPAKLANKLQADSSQHLIVKFALSRTVHQAFLRMYSNNKEIIFVAEQDSSKIYKVEVNLQSELSQSGEFQMELILGDAVISNPIRWQLGEIQVQLGGGGAAAEGPKASVTVTRGPRPEIKHLFREPEKRPAEVVSLFFTGLTAAPLLILLILWARIGINLGNFTLLALPFHVGFASILGLFTLFWLQMDMFTTCAWLIPIGGFTFLTGQRLLSHIASNRKQEKSDK